MDEFHGMKLLALCGRGGFGEVYYCEEISGRRFALKIVHKNPLGEEWKREFEGVKKYSSITADVPELLKIYHVDEDKECFWYTMEPADSADPEKYVPDTLAGRLAAGPLPPEALYPVLSDIFRGLRAIHETGFVHRDIKPANIIFVKGVPKLADIGLLSSLANSMTGPAGTLGFLSPEARNDAALNSSDPESRRRNDLYAFGKVVYCAVSGNNDPTKFPNIPPEVSLASLPVKLFHRLARRLCEDDLAHRIATLEAAEKELELIGRSLEAGKDLSGDSRFGGRGQQLRNVFCRFGSSAKGWRVFAAHLTDFGISSYMVGFAAGFLGYADTVGKVLTFVIGWAVSVLFSSVLAAWIGITPSEWLWGCKFRKDESVKSGFGAYLLSRIRMKNSAFEDYKNTTPKTVAACAILLAVIGIYCL